MARTVLLAGSLVWLAGLWLFLPELRLGMRAYLGCLWVVVAWFALARTKTLTWSGFLRFFTLCVPWSVTIGILTTVMAGQVAQIDLIAVSETGAQVAIAGIVEETGKLVPVVLLALLAPRRAARFATADWLLLGLASGTAFLAVEEAARRTAIATGNAGIASMLGLTPDGVLPPGYVSFGLIPIPTPMGADDTWSLAPTTVAEFGGHAIMTALVTGLFGLALAAWQARRRLTGLALGLLPAAMLWSAIADHAMYNAGLDLFSALPGDGDTPAWLDPDSTTIPWWLRVPWSLLGHGHGRIGVFLALVVVCLLVDAARLAPRPAANLTGQPAPGWVTRPVAGAPTVVRAVLGAVTGLVWVVARDLAQAIAGHARRRPDIPEAQPEPRRAAAARGAALVSGQRALRELAYDHASARIHPWARRLAAVAVLGALGWLALAVAPATAREIGTSTNDMYQLPGTGPTEAPSDLPTDVPTELPSDFPTVPPLDLPTQMPTDLPTSLPSDFPSISPDDLPSGFPTFDPDDFPSLSPDFEFPSASPSASEWLAGVLDALADWWHDQPLLVQLAIGAGIAALVVLSGGSLMLGIGISGVLTWGLDHSAGIATFTRNPRQATRDYFATATPAQLAADTLGVALTFAPGNFAGAATGRILRTTADDLVADPAAWLATRRHAFTRAGLADEAGAINLEHLLARKPVPLADGTTQPALSAADDAAAAALYESYPSTAVKGADGPARDGQIAVYGDNERVISVPDKDIEVHPDGFTSQYGAVGDYKHVASASTWHDPRTLDPRLYDMAVTKIDRTLQRLQHAADQVMNGGGVVEITTNSRSAGEFIEGRMRDLGLRGYVRITSEVE
ncbi:protease prsW family protein [Promicromonospora sp. AC04]|uniref:PrsW family glutamic-type intramembrane protease n=1 Tax=Promicromonospora sp. AC04 TaxID=2135723 RepID=UPI000D4EBBB5|nr:PrsW family glutamic-type intramembrane protease [Promicromonospora sp. AC04]PUB19862.1 protease prsW family protein [Promicromonospora sp. AC04]